MLHRVSQMEKTELILQALKDRYNHLKLVYGEHDPYMAGFRDCMSIFEMEIEDEKDI